MGSDALGMVREHEIAAMATLAAVAGHTSLCVLSRSGTSYPAAKYHEGAVSALAEVRRALTQSPTPELPAARVIAIREAWTVRSSGTLGAAPGWHAYYRGGIEALDQLLAPVSETREGG